MIDPAYSFDIVTAPKRDSRHWTPGTVTWAEILRWMEAPATVKEAGNYILGSLRQTTVQHPRADRHCTNYHRTKVSIVRRGALTLDIDHPGVGFSDIVDQTLLWAAVLHTTYSSTPEHPRYRLIIPLDRTVAPDEYYAAAGAVMQALGEENFDPGSVQAERYMFKPASADPEDFWFTVIPGNPAPVDKLLASFKQDLSSIPVPKPSKAKRDPFAIEGTVGAFNRAYEDFDHLIQVYELPYEESGLDRWKLAGASAAAGMGKVTDGLVFSHHANDPAYGQTCTAFDLVRLHLYGDLDEDLEPGIPVNRRPSYKEMLERATRDSNVVRELVGSDFDEELDSTEESIKKKNWRLDFKLEARTGKPEDDIRNWDLISNNDPVFDALYYNELSLSIEVDEDLPWRKLRPGQETFSNGDRSSLALYIERQYHIRPGRGYLDDLINDRAYRRRVNPVRDYLESLSWDGTKRVETCLPGVVATAYTKLVARKCMTAAVARMMEPGIKWDHMLVIYGLEGLGKSHWIDKMAKGYSSKLGRIGDKDTLITMQRSWIMTSDEGHTMKKADFDAQKEFITGTADIFRMPYEREAQVHKRHCVIWGTTNDDVFLKRQEGNRRFLVVRSEGKVDFNLLTDEYIDQVWAEAMHYYREGEQLWLEEDEDTLARTEREEFTEEDALHGIIQHYVDTLVPEHWDSMSPENRQGWLMNSDDELTQVGTHRIDRVCSLQIWIEAMGRRKGDHKRMDLLEISTALKQLKGWKLLPGTHRCGPYGPQKVFERIVLEEDFL